MSVFAYNGVALPYAYCPNGMITNVYDPQGNTDWVLSRYEFQIQSVISAAYVASLGVAGSNPAEIMVNVRKALMTHRKQLSYKFGPSPGTELIPQKQTGNTGVVDAENGPKPLACTITNLTNQAWLINYHIVAQYWENLGTDADTGLKINRPGNTVLFNRWTESVELDGADYSVRTRHGIARIRSDNVSGLTADAIRKSMCVVSVPNGFVRDRSSYTISPDGLALDYKMVDREVFLLPPSPAFTASGSYTETGVPNDITRYGGVEITLTGRKDFIDDNGAPTSFANLIQTAVGVAASTLLISGATKNDNGAFTKLTNASLTVDRWKSSVKCVMSAQMNPHTTPGGKGRRAGAVGINFNKFTTPPVGSAPGDTRGPYNTDRGSAGLFLQAAAYYDPSLTSTTMRRGIGQLSTGNVPGQEGKLGG